MKTLRTHTYTYECQTFQESKEKRKKTNDRDILELFFIVVVAGERPAVEKEARCECSAP